MQREQINRDFNELKAKLDIIAKHNSMYDDVSKNLYFGFLIF